MLPGLCQYSPPCGQVVLGTSSLSVRQCLLDRLQGSIIHKCQCQCQSLCASRSAVHCAYQWTGLHNDLLVGLLVCSSSRCLMLYEILCWLLPCLTLAARVFYRAVAASDCRFVFACRTLTDICFSKLTVCRVRILRRHQFHITCINFISKRTTE